MKKLTNEEFINKCKIIHNNKFDYSKTSYKKCIDNVIVICPIHGEFKIKGSNHLHMNQGCVKCAQDNHKLTIISKEKMEKFKIIHNNKYIYNDITVISGKIKIECLEHGEFEQIIYHHIKGHGCPSCNSSSKGENTIKNWLENNKIKFIRNYQFEDCKRERALRFDFYLPEQNICIEFDGEHHFEENEYFGKGNLEYITKNDEIKNEYCSINNIQLIRIPYWENITERLKENLTISI